MSDPRPPFQAPPPRDDAPGIGTGGSDGQERSPAPRPMPEHAQPSTPPAETWPQPPGPPPAIPAPGPHEEPRKAEESAGEVTAWGYYAYHAPEAPPTPGAYPSYPASTAFETDILDPGPQPAAPQEISYPDPRASASQEISYPDLRASYPDVLETTTGRHAAPSPAAPPNRPLDPLDPAWTPPREETAGSPPDLGWASQASQTAPVTPVTPAGSPPPPDLGWPLAPPGPAPALPAQPEGAVSQTGPVAPPARATARTDPATAHTQSGYTPIPGPLMSPAPAGHTAPHPPTGYPPTTHTTDPATAHTQIHHRPTHPPTGPLISPAPADHTRPPATTGPIPPQAPPGPERQPVPPGPIPPQASPRHGWQPAQPDREGSPEHGTVQAPAWPPSAPPGGLRSQETIPAGLGHLPSAPEHPSSPRNPSLAESPASTETLDRPIVPSPRGELPEQRRSRRRTPRREEETPSSRGRKKREPYLDNVKFVLITLVVTGHSLVPTLGERSARAAYLFIYMFHMPAFVLLSGYLGRNFWNSNAKINKLVDTMLVPYVFVEIGYALLRYALGQKWTLTIIDPAWLNWYLVALVLWRISTPIWTRMRQPLLVAVVIYMMAGFSEISGDFSLDRFFGLLPFYVLGLLLKPEHFDLLKPLQVKIAGGVALAAGAVVALIVAPRVGLDPIYFRYSFKHMDMSWGLGLAVRGGVLVAALVLTVALFAVVPRHQTWFSELGTRTLYAYLLHGVVVLIAKDLGWLSVSWLHGPLGVPAIASSALVLAIVLCLPVTRRFFKWLLEPRLIWLYRKPPARRPGREGAAAAPR